MSVDNEVPPIPYTPVPNRSIEFHNVLTQLDDEVLLIRMGIWRRVVFLVFTGSIGCFCAPFLIALHSSLTIENYRLSQEIMPFAWASVAVVLVLFVVSVGMLLLSPIRFDRSSGSVGRGGWIPGWWKRNLKDVLAIQICRGKADITLGERGSRGTINRYFQLNLVFDDSPPTRRNLCEQADLKKVEHAAKQIADFVGTPILNYVGSQLGTLEKTDAEARRLLAARRLRQSKMGIAVLCLLSVGTLHADCGRPAQSYEISAAVTEQHEQQTVY